MTTVTCFIKDDPNNPRMFFQQDFSKISTKGTVTTVEKAADSDSGQSEPEVEVIDDSDSGQSEPEVDSEAEVTVLDDSDSGHSQSKPEVEVGDDSDPRCDQAEGQPVIVSAVISQKLLIIHHKFLTPK